MSSSAYAKKSDANVAADSDMQPGSGDLFSMFYLPSSRTYDEDIHMTTLAEQSNDNVLSSYIPFQGVAAAASSMLGDIFSALDTAIAIMNEEFEEEEHDDDNDTNDSYMNNVSSKENIRCQTQSKNTKLKTSIEGDTKQDDKTSDNSVTKVHNNSNTNMPLERSDSQELDNYSPQYSLIGSISTLQVYEEGSSYTSSIMKLLSDADPTNDIVLDEKDVGDKSEVCKKEDYCIISNKKESETTDGWLVVSED